MALRWQGYRARGIAGAHGYPSRAALGGTLTVHVISMLFFLVPSPFTSLGLDSGAGTQIDTKFKPNLCLTRACEHPLSLPPDQSL